MMKTSTLLVLLATVAAPVAPLASQTRASHPVTVTSPDGRTHAELSADGGILRYRIVVDSKQVLAPSMIGIEADDVELGQDVTLVRGLWRLTYLITVTCDGEIRLDTNAYSTEMPAL